MPPRPFPFFAETDLITPGEVSWLKFLGILLMVLWTVYLIKEIFFSHRRDPLVDALATSVGSLTTGMAAQGARMEAQERRLTELVLTQRDDVKNIFTEIKAYKASIDAVLLDHEHEIGAAARKPR